MNVWPAGDSELAGCVRNFDWRQTALGQVSGWSWPLKTTVDLLLRSPLPMILMWGQDGVMIYNDGYAKIAGNKHPKILGENVLDGWPEVRDFNQQVMSVGMSGGALSFQDQKFLLYRTDEPEYVWLDLYYSPVIGDSGKPEGVLAMVVETTQRLVAERQRERVELALLESNKHLRQANTDLEQFAYSASHDLQEPLRTVVIYSQLLKRRYSGKLDAEADAIIDTCVQAGLRMSDLISDLLEYTMVASDSIHSADAISLVQPLKDALQNLQTAIEQAGAAVTYGPLPRVRVKAVHFRQIFQNLVGNAIKYRSERPLEVRVSAEESNNEWVVTVADNGIGIEKVYLDQVFGLFKRLHGVGQYPGTGVGLALCKRWVERYGGRIWVESEFGQGSKFHFTLPGDKKE